MDIEQQKQILDKRMSKLREAREALKEQRDKELVNLHARISRLQLLSEDASTLMESEQSRIMAMGAILKTNAYDAQLAAQEIGMFLRMTPRGKKLLSETRRTVKANAQFEKDLPDTLAGIRREARAQAEKNFITNCIKRKALGSLPSRVDNMNAALEAVSKGDPAVATCLLRGQIERALRIARIWKSRQLGEKTTIAELGEYMQAYSERDAPYEASDTAMAIAQAETARNMLLEKSMNELRLRSILKALQEAGGPVTIVDAEWEEVNTQPPFLLQDNTGHVSTP